MRVVSLVPSETYSLFAFGLGDRLVGRTEYCVEPCDGVEGVATVGGTKNPDVEAIMALEPDLVLANKEENTRAPLEALARERVRVFVSFPRSVRDSVGHVARLARLFQVEGVPEVQSLIRRGYSLTAEDPPPARFKVFVPVWNDPLMSFSERTYADDVLRWAGFENVCADRERRYPLKADLAMNAPVQAADFDGRDRRYPRLSTAEVESRGPEVILLPDEPYRFAEEDVATFRALSTPASEGDGIHLVSGKDLFWHGAWTVAGVERLAALQARVR